MDQVQDVGFVTDTVENKVAPIFGHGVAVIIIIFIHRQHGNIRNIVYTIYKKTVKLHNELFKCLNLFINLIFSDI